MFLIAKQKVIDNTLPGIFIPFYHFLTFKAWYLQKASYIHLT